MDVDVAGFSHPFFDIAGEANWPWRIQCLGGCVVEVIVPFLHGPVIVDGVVV